MAHRCRVVLDTNVVLDLLRFRDYRTAGLATALSVGRVCALTDSRCRAEFERVLGYEVLSLDNAARASLVREYASLVIEVASVDRVSVEGLPRCSDPDDQKFIELTWRTGADLLTRDRALLALQRRFGKLGKGRICTPEELFPVDFSFGERAGNSMSDTSDLRHNFASPAGN